MKRAQLSAVVVLVLAAAAIAGCGSSSDSSSSSGGSTASSGGKLTIGVNLALKPWGFVDNGNDEGINVEYGEALAKQLGKEVEIQPVTIDSMIPGLEAGRYDIVLATANDTAEREQHIDFVDYAIASSGVLTKTGEGGDYNTVEDLCGHAVGVDRGSVNQIVLEEQQCPSGSSIDLSLFGDDNASALALQSGQIDAIATDSALVGLLAKESPDEFEATAISYAGGPVGATLAKSSPLLPEIEKATQALIDSGELKQVFTKWGAPDAPLGKAKVNVAG